MAHIDVLVELAAEPNIAIKATGTPSMATDDFPFRSVHPFLKRLYDAYGADRMFWGTDITRMRISWRDCAAMFTDHLPWLSGEAQQKVMGEALRTWIGWR